MWLNMKTRLFSPKRKREREKERYIWKKKKAEYFARLMKTVSLQNQKKFNKPQAQEMWKNLSLFLCRYCVCLHWLILRSFSFHQFQAIWLQCALVQVLSYFLFNYLAWLIVVIVTLWILSSPNRNVEPPVTQNMTVFGNKVFTEVITLKWDPLSGP